MAPAGEISSTTGVSAVLIVTIHGGLRSILVFAACSPHARDTLSDSWFLAFTVKQIEGVGDTSNGCHHGIATLDYPSHELGLRRGAGQ